MASHYRITTEEDGSKRLCTWGATEDGTDLKVKILEVNEAGKKVMHPMCVHRQECYLK